MRRKALVSYALVHCWFLKPSVLLLLPEVFSNPLDFTAHQQKQADNKNTTLNLDYWY